MIACGAFTRVDEWLVMSEADSTPLLLLGLIIENDFGLLDMEVAQLLRFSAPSTHLLVINNR